MRGWVLDCYADMAENRMVTWVWTNHGVERVVDELVPRFYVRASRERLDKLAGGLAQLGVKDVSVVRRRTELGGKEREVLSVAVRDYASLQPLAVTIDSWGGYRDHLLYNVDLRMDQRYFLAKGIFAMGLV